MVMTSIDKLLTAAAQEIWRKTYGVGGSEDDALRMVNARVEEMNVGPHDVRATDSARLGFAVQWVHGACMTLTTSHKFAAALCVSTSRGEDVLSDIELPSRAFRILVPNGILSNETYNIDFSQINFCIWNNGSALLHLEGLGPVIRTGPDAGSRRLASMPYFVQTDDGSSIAKLLADRDDDEQSFVVAPGAEVQQSLEEREVRVRMLVLARRLISGLLLTFTHTTDWSEKKGPRGRDPRDPREPPKHRNIFIGRPITLDARPAIARYLGGGVKGGAPAVQSMVRGHHKRQVIGVARSGRKVIWVEPYWRGPEDAPILARPYHVGPR